MRIQTEYVAHGKVGWGAQGRSEPRLGSSRAGFPAHARPAPVALRPVLLRPDVAFLTRQGVPASIPELASRLAAMRGTEAREELFAQSFDAQRYWAMLAADLGLGFVPELNGARLVVSAGFLTTEAVRRANSVRVMIDGELLLVRAPDAEEIPRLQALLRDEPDSAARIRIAAPETIRSFLVSQRQHVLSHYAINRLARTLPRCSAQILSAGTRAGAPQTVASVALSLLVLSPTLAAHALFLLLTLLFTNCTLWKLAAAFRRPLPLRLQPLSDAELPSYSVLVPLYREAAVVPDLLDHLGKLHYPAAKLQIVILLESDDAESARAVALHATSRSFETIIIPPGGPRTKPKALTYALPFARGDCVVVFDAEDRPEPDQLRKAASAFAGYPELGCVQARLQPDNRGSWLTRMFTLEYAANFEVLLPALSSWRVPLPLGGTSNHFPREVLDAVGGWDPFNVTEDADLGIRLARFGYRVATLRSRTYEEAPVTFRQWLPQRRRWIKGWIQTSLVCMAGRLRPGLRLAWRERLAIHAIMTAGVLGLLLYPLSLLVLGTTLAAIARGDLPLGVWEWLFLGSTLGNFTLLYLAAVVSAARGLSATGNLRLLVLIPGLFIYWGLMSLAAWQALIQFIRAPSTWEKTTHGVAKDRRTPRVRPYLLG